MSNSQTSNLKEKNVESLSLDEKRALLAQLLWQSANEQSVTYQLSYGQQALWFLHQIDSEFSAYNTNFAAVIREGLNIPLLQSALQALLDRHPSLRTTYSLQDGVLKQRVHAQTEVDFTVIDVRHYSDQQLREEMLQEARARFDLESGPLMRVCLYQKADNEDYLLMTNHHIVLDYWSLAVMLDDLAQLYRSKLMGEKTQLPSLTTDYASFVRYQKALIEGEDGARLKGYWERRLSGSLFSSQWLGKSKKTNQLKEYKSYLFNFDDELVVRMKEQCKSLNTTLYTYMLSVFNLLLSFYTGQEELMVGSPTAGRNRAEFERVVGYFVNPVLLLSHIDWNQSFQEVLGHIRQVVLEAMEHQDYPFPLLVEQFQPMRDSKQSPLIEVMFAFQKAPRLEDQGLTSFILGDQNAKLNLGGLILEPLGLPQQEGQFDLTLHIDSVKLAAALQYNTSIYDSSMIERMAMHFQILLEQIVDNPDTRLSDLSMLTEEERHQLLVEWNDTAVEFPQELLIHQLFEEQVNKNPDAEAVWFEGQRMSYAELNAKANQLAHYLQDNGIQSGDHIGICLERSPDMIISVLGVLKAGAAYVPLDPTHPKERFTHILNDASVALVLTATKLVERLPEEACSVILMDQAHSQMDKYSVISPEIGSRAEDLAYIIYTSGSTGTPKGVMVQHRAVVNLIDWVNTTFGMNEQDKVLWVTSLGFDLSVYDLFGLLAAGGSIRIVPEAEVRDPERLLALLDEEGITFWDSAPAAMQQLAPLLHHNRENARGRANTN